MHSNIDFYARPLVFLNLCILKRSLASLPPHQPAEPKNSTKTKKEMKYSGIRIWEINVEKDEWTTQITR